MNNLISYQAFFDCVREMRMNQKMFFSTGSKTFLNESKRLERQVDSYIEKLLEPNPQLQIF